MNIDVDLDPNLRWCPRNGCLRYVRKRRFRNKAICECGQEVCMRCGRVAHGRIRCVNVGDDEFNEWAKDMNIKPCPNCKIKTWKYDGCNHITC